MIQKIIPKKIEKLIDISVGSGRFSFELCVKRQKYVFFAIYR